jgi:DNA-binding ferritin-like protein
MMQAYADFEVDQDPMAGMPQSPQVVTASRLLMCAAFAKELETQAHLIHLNYEGSNFLPVHGFLKDQYQGHLEEFDVLAEHMRAMDYLMPMCGCGLKDAACGFEKVESYDSSGMLMTYMRNLEQQKSLATELEESAGQARAVDVQNTAAGLVAACAKAAWFLKATLRC